MVIAVGLTAQYPYSVHTWYKEITGITAGRSSLQRHARRKGRMNQTTAHLEARAAGEANGFFSRLGLLATW